jgi:hypothetical protein
LAPASFPAPHARHESDHAAFVWSKAPLIVDAFERGVTIRSKKGFWLAIPTPVAGATGLDASGAKKGITPGGWDRRTSMRLRFVYRRGQPSLLVADDARLAKSGLACSRVRKSKAGGSYVPVAGRQTIVVFILVPQVTLRKRLDVEGAAERWGDRVGDLIAQLARRRQAEEAAAFAANVIPIIGALRFSGVQDLRGLAAALNNRGVRTGVADVGMSPASRT